jgi:polyisoprenoid-binding protein YceI
MIPSTLSKWFTALLISFISFYVYAAIPTWHIVPNESNLTFTGIQNGAPVQGSFKKFSGEIRFDPNQLSASKVRIFIDMNSVSMSFSDFISTLMTSDWLDVSQYPQAIFESSHFSKIGTNLYQARGTLSLRGKKMPITLNFTALQLSKTKGRVAGRTTIKRSLFGIGQGEWADTQTIKDSVEINFIITAKQP